MSAHRVYRPATGESTPVTAGAPVLTSTTCQWCGLECGTPTEHMVHVSLDHPEAIGRGRTRSRTWSCGCGAENRPDLSVCPACSTSAWWAEECAT